MITGKNFKEFYKSARNIPLHEGGGGGAGRASISFADQIRKALNMDAGDSSDSNNTYNPNADPIGDPVALEPVNIQKPLNQANPQDTSGVQGAAGSPSGATVKPTIAPTQNWPTNNMPAPKDSSVAAKPTVVPTNNMPAPKDNTQPAAAPQSNNKTTSGPSDYTASDKTTDSSDPQAFQFGSTKGSSKVSADELNKWKQYNTDNGLVGSTLGQYMNARDGKTAQYGSKNYNQDLQDAGLDKDVQPVKPVTPVTPTAEAPKPPEVPKAPDVPLPPPRPKNPDSNNKGKNNMSESTNPLIEGFMKLHSKKHDNMFSYMKENKQIVNAKPIENKGSNTVHINKTGSHKGSEPMPKLDTKGEEKHLANIGGTVSGTTRKAAEPMPKIKAKWIEKWLTGAGVHEETIQKALEIFEEEYSDFLDLSEEVLTELSKKTLGNYVKKASDDRDERTNNLSRDNATSSVPYSDKKREDRKKGIYKAVKKLTKEDVEAALAEGIELIELDEEVAPHMGEFHKGFCHGYTGSKPASKATCHYFKGFEEGKREKTYDHSSGKYHKGNADAIGNKKAISYSSYGREMGMYESFEEFTDEEIEHLNSLLGEEDAPVKRGRGRPKGSKSGSAHGERSEEGDGYGTKNVAAQIRTSRPYFKGGTEVKKITHPEKNTEHEVPLKHVNDFSDAYSAAEKPQDKLNIEKKFVSTHLK